MPLRSRGRFVFPALHEVRAHHQRTEAVARRHRRLVGHHAQVDVRGDRIVESDRRRTAADVELFRTERCDHARRTVEDGELCRDAHVFEVAELIGNEQRYVGRRAEKPTVTVDALCAPTGRDEITAAAVAAAPANTLRRVIEGDSSMPYPLLARRG